MLIKRAIRTSLLTAVALSLLFAWFFLLPRSQFAIGMTLHEIETRLGHQAHLIPIRRDQSADAAYRAAYMISVNRYGLHLYLNADKRVVRIAYLFGSEQHPHYAD